MDKVKEFWARITWPQVALLTVVVVAVIVAAHSLPADRWDALMSLALAVLASLGLAVGGPLLRGGGGALVLVVLVSGALVGCGASPLRQHATAARLTIATLEGAGVAIEEATRVALDACPPAGTERAQCIDDVDGKATYAAAVRDTLIAPAHAYRDAVLASGDDSSPELLEYLAVVGGRVLRDWPTLTEALRALGLPVPVVMIPGVHQ